MLVEELKEGDITGAFVVGKDLELETQITLYLNPKHPFYIKFLNILESVQKRQKGLIKCSIGL